MSEVATPLAGEQRVLLEQVSWEAYEALLKSWENTSKRLTYDQGRLELMSPLLSHEQYHSLIGQLIWAFTQEMRIPRHTGGATTLRKQSAQRGLEPDECYWIQHEARMRSRKEFDPETDPPPDLAIEVDITNSSLDRMSIYADLGVPEVWRFDGENFTIHLLTLSGKYEQSEKGLALPALSVAVVSRFLGMSDSVGEMELLDAFLDWVRSEVKPPTKKRRPRQK